MLRTTRIVAGLTTGQNVSSQSMREAPNYPASFVAGKRTIGVEFMFKNPLARNHVSAGRSRDETPRPIVDQRPKLVGHGSPPIGVGEGAVVVGRYRADRGGMCGGEVQPIDRFQGACLRPGDDAVESIERRRALHQPARWGRRPKHRRMSCAAG